MEHCSILSRVVLDAQSRILIYTSVSTHLAFLSSNKCLMRGSIEAFRYHIPKDIVKSWASEQEDDVNSVSDNSGVEFEQSDNELVLDASTDGGKDIH
jgi:hypothetical protein